jgi:hypothetical protein
MGRPWRSGFASAEKLQVLEPHDNAVDAPCPHFGPCGGCSYQNLAYAAQLVAKQDQVRGGCPRHAFTECLLPNPHNCRVVTGASQCSAGVNSSVNPAATQSSIAYADMHELHICQYVKCRACLISA